MTTEPAEGGRIIPYMGVSPTIAPGVFVAAGAVILGDVTIGADSSVWFNVVIRGDVHWIRIGERTNVQDLAMLHCTYKKNPLSIGNDVTIGHHAMLHGCTIEDAVLIGMNATVLDRAVVEHHSMVAAGSVVREGFRIPSGTLAAGVPAKIVRDLTDDERAFLEQSSRNYMFYVSTFRQSEKTP
ncbi:MAG: gamma carbonic anhydrase family protein [Candidatus Kapabacteria bacterium]|jgi:carbonic anhydrase/acetyltransferase-like protein (isoleucine patch superfamily)|nr:gamma carbonic anhydrase family protein [Candidatus Kapabacteria bacterium]